MQKMQHFLNKCAVLRNGCGNIISDANANGALQGTQRHDGVSVTFGCWAALATAADCKSVALKAAGFESLNIHQIVAGGAGHRQVSYA
jgi:hypothetical protein